MKQQLTLLGPGVGAQITALHHNRTSEDTGNIQAFLCLSASQRWYNLLQSMHDLSKAVQSFRSDQTGSVSSLWARLYP